MLPHLPQFSGSVRGSMHSPAQNSRPFLQSPPTSPPVSQACGKRTARAASINRARVLDRALMAYFLSWVRPPSAQPAEVSVGAQVASVQPPVRAAWVPELLWEARQPAEVKPLVAAPAGVQPLVAAQLAAERTS